MRGLARVLAASAAIAVVSSSALAADVVVIPPPAPPPVPIVDPPFAGPYWGVYGGYSSESFRGQRRGGPQVGTQFGYNFGTGSLRFGIEIEAENNRWLIPTLVEASLNARIGVVLGNNNLMVYGQAGIGTLLGAPAVNFGGGVEFLLNANLALFAEAKVTRQGLGGPPGAQILSIRGGVNYYADEGNLDAAGNFDWGGLYMGGHAGAIVGAPGGALGIAGVQVGYNFVGGGPLVFGAEVEVNHPFAPVAIVTAALNGRVGFTFGSILAYAEAGIGSFIGVAPFWSIGGGAELALGDRLSLFAEVKRLTGFGGAGGSLTQIAGGVNVQFGR